MKPETRRAYGDVLRISEVFQHLLDKPENVPTGIKPGSAQYREWITLIRDHFVNDPSSVSKPLDLFAQCLLTQAVGFYTPGMLEFHVYGRPATEPEREALADRQAWIEALKPKTVIAHPK